MTQITYTDRIKTQNSSVISDIYYNVDEGLLFIQLRRDDVLCGYRGVPVQVYNSFAYTEASGGSVGSYWNRFVKEHYEGYETADVELVPSETAAMYEKKPAPNVVPSNIFDLSSPERRYEVVVEVKRRETFSVYATDLDAALANVNDNLDEAGAEYRFVSATQFFE